MIIKFCYKGRSLQQMDPHEMGPLTTQTDNHIANRIARNEQQIDQNPGLNFDKIL